MMKCRVNDCYHRAFFYVMGIAEETRNNINAMFDFKTDCIEPEECTADGRQAARSRSATLLFNLWNGYAEDGREVFHARGIVLFANLPLLYGGHQGGIPNIAGIYPRLRSRPSLHGKTKY